MFINNICYAIMMNCQVDTIVVQCTEKIWAASHKKIPNYIKAWNIVIQKVGWGRIAALILLFVRQRLRPFGTFLRGRTQRCMNAFSILLLSSYTAAKERNIAVRIWSYLLLLLIILGKYVCLNFKQEENGYLSC